MTNEASDLRLSAARQRSEEIRRRASADPAAAAEMLPEATQELETALEELTASWDDLLAQSEELAGTRALLEDERRRYQDLFDFAPDAYLVTDLAGTVREANRAAAGVLGLAQEFLKGTSLVRFVAAEARAAFQDLLARVGTDGARREWEGRFCTRKKAAFDAALTVAPISDSRGKPSGLRWLIRDVTGQKDQVRLATLGTLAAGLAHEGGNALQR